MNWLDPHQGYVGNLNILLGAITNKQKHISPQIQK